MIVLVGLGIAAYLLMSKNANASSGNGSGWMAGRQFLRSPADASQVGRAPAPSDLGVITAGLAGLFGVKAAARAGASQTTAQGFAALDRIEKTNAVDPLYRTGAAEYNESTTGDPYNSGYDAVASNPAPNVPWDSWFSGTGGMGD